MTSPQPTALSTAWQRLAPREQSLVLAAAAVVGLALLWWVLLAPALHTLRSAGAQHQKLNTELQQMQALQAQAQQLQALPRANPADAARALQNSVAQSLGSGARLALAGDRATLSLKGVSASALSAWLAQARSNAHAITQEAQLTRSPAATTDGPVRWDGTLVLTLPSAP